MRDKVEKVLGTIKFCAGGDKGRGKIELVDVKEGVVTVKLIGGCGSCPGGCNVANFGTKMFIERRLKQEIPEVKKVNAIFWIM